MTPQSPPNPALIAETYERGDQQLVLMRRIVRFLGDWNRELLGGAPMRSVAEYEADEA